MKKSACIETLYTELPWEDRFAAAKNDGFDYVEFWNWPEKDLNQLKQLADQAGIGICGFNGDADYSLIDPAQKTEYLAYLEQSLQTAQKLGALSVTIHSNALGDGGVVVDYYLQLSDTVKICTMFDNLKDVAALAEKYGIVCNLEGLNITTDHVGNYLRSTQMAAEMIRLIGSDKVKILYDVYHMQLNEGAIMDTLAAYIDTIGHIHIADAPGRHEPGTGEINYVNVVRHLNNLGYCGIVGSELFPEHDTATAVKAIMSIF
jgi:hydroxypyruvate isomerase